MRTGVLAAVCDSLLTTSLSEADVVMLAGKLVVIVIVVVVR